MIAREPSDEPRGDAASIWTMARRGLRTLRALALVPRGAAMCVAGLPRGEVRVFYGHTRIPRPSEPTLGGIVKLQRMQEMFPNAPLRFSILYMVSSALPHAPVAIAWLARSKGARFVWNQNGVAYPAWYGPGWQRINAPMARLLRMADYVFYQSEFCRQSADIYLGKREGPWEILHNAVDTAVFTPPKVPPPASPLTLLVGGTQDLFYRLSTALQVLALVARERLDVRMLVTGRLRWIPDEAECERTARRRAAELGVEDRVKFLGPYAQEDAPRLFQQAHILVHAKYNDPCPGMVVEALACGLPVVYSCSGGTPELVGRAAGIGVPAELSWEREIPPDPSAMARAVLEVAERRKEFAEAARQRAIERFDLRPWLRRHQEVFVELLR